MPIGIRRAYLAAIRERYGKSTKKEKRHILSEFCTVCGYTRKYAIRILGGKVQPRIRRSGPKSKYDSNVVHHLRILWGEMNRMCSKKMAAALPLWLPFYKDVDSETRNLLLEISPSTIDRLLLPTRAGFKSKGISTTQPSMLKHKIPIQLLDHEVDRPGFVEGDTVAHCGDNIAGEYVHTLTVTDLFSGWTENRSTWRKLAEGIVELMKGIEADLPFQLLGYASDNGSEFINDELYDYFNNRKTGKVEFVRRRPYKKNDSAHVEQKNWTHVRELFGYDRFDVADLNILMNEIYRAYWNPLLNYFSPMMKLKNKTRIGGKLKKEYDDPKTPYQRLIECDKIPLQTKRKLIEQYKMKNPFHLKAELERKLKIFFKIVEMYKEEKRKPGA
jgi:hypothetical protein